MERQTVRTGVLEKGPAASTKRDGRAANIARAIGAVGDQVTRSDPWRQAGAAPYGILEATASWKLLVRGEVDNQQDERPGDWAGSSTGGPLLPSRFRKTLPAVRGQPCPPSNRLGPFRNKYGTCRPSALVAQPHTGSGRQPRLLRAPPPAPPPTP